MNKIFLVIRREYLARVRKKSFIVMTIAAPLLLVAFYGIIFYFALNRDIGESEKRIYVVDQSGKFTGKLDNKKNVQFVYGGDPMADVKPKSFLENENYYAILTIPDSAGIPQLHNIKLVATDQAGMSTIAYIESQIEKVIKEDQLTAIGIDQKQISEINKIRVSIATATATNEGEESNSAGASTFLGFGGALLIYLFIFLYGVQVMRGVIEEKTNRIIEVIISSLKPFELMMGKIIGIALVGLTQFVIWVLLITILGGGLSGIIASQMHLTPETTDALTQGKQIADTGEVSGIFDALRSFNYAYLIGMFLFYFISGYLFYGALFAAIGSAVDNETDTQQFMFPVTMPLVFAFVLAQSAVVTNPNGPMAFWLSVIPFTAPVVMMVRVPFGVESWEIAVSMLSMIAGFVFTVWLAGRIYRIGILMYGKKPSYKEIGKWLFYKG